MNTLVMLYHDPSGSNYDNLDLGLRKLEKIFDHIITDVSKNTYNDSIDLLKNYGEVVITAPCIDLINEVGRKRRLLLKHAIEVDSNHIFYCDGDRALHWANNHYDELRQCVKNIHLTDFTVYGRTNKAWISHPEAQKSTESIVNRMFANKTALEWDMLAAARGISAKAAKFIVDNSNDDTFGVDVSWPILMQENDFSMSYVRVNGLSFEGINRDDSIEEWIHRTKIVQIELEAML